MNQLNNIIDQTVNRAFEEGRKAGIKEVVDWVSNNIPMTFKRTLQWENKLKEWGIEDK